KLLLQKIYPPSTKAVSPGSNTSRFRLTGALRENYTRWKCQELARRRGVFIHQTALTAMTEQKGVGMMKRYLLLVSALLMVCVFASALIGQSITGRIVGTITDETGAVLPGVQIVVR